jgi:hypothetical protein
MAFLMDPMYHRSSRDEFLFSELFETVRKDVECTLGIFYQGLRYLWGENPHHSVVIIEIAMKVCCMLRKMLLHFDGKVPLLA